jgi:hypothetical protein
MKRVVIIHWKKDPEKLFEVFSNLKILCESYPTYSYNTLNNYLSKNKIPFENTDVRIERKVVQTEAARNRQIAIVANRLKMRGHDEEKQNLDFWMSRTAGERLEAATMLSAQLKKTKNQRMDKTVYIKRKIK